MKKLFSHLFITLCGLVTAAVAVAINFLGRDYLDTEIFTWSVYFIFPVGAILLGLVSATGYVLGSWLTNTRPHWSLLVQMLIIAGLANAAIYFMEYRMAMFDDGMPVHVEYSFPQYMQETLTTAHYTIGRQNSDMGEVGQWGYAIALLQFIGFLGGSLCAYIFLKRKLYCAPCQKYLRGQGKIARRFENEVAFQPHYNTLTAAVPSAMTLATFASQPDLPKKPRHGAHELKATLYHCPSCQAQTVQYTVHVLGSNWNLQDDLTKANPVPPNMDLKPIFAKK